MVVTSFILGCVAVGAMIYSFFACTTISAVLSNASTLMSIILGIMSIVYSYRSNKQTEELLKKINEKFLLVAENSKTSLIQQNLGNASIENAITNVNDRQK